MIPIVCIVGKSDVGKTTLLEKIVPILVSRGYRVATVKHDAHSFEIDHEGKDSWRHKHAGATMSVISSPERVAVVADANHDHSLAELREKFVRDVDLMISEGYKRETHPKIEVFRSDHSTHMLCGEGDNLIAVAGDPPQLPEGVPVFDLNDPVPLCDFLENRFLVKRQR
jgi:molybdopterin-guanine dinucleotide biosynthesis adapter protein